MPSERRMKSRGQPIAARKWFGRQPPATPVSRSNPISESLCFRLDRPPVPERLARPLDRRVGHPIEPVSRGDDDDAVVLRGTLHPEACYALGGASEATSWNRAHPTIRRGSSSGLGRAHLAAAVQQRDQVERRLNLVGSEPRGDAWRAGVIRGIKRHRRHARVDTGMPPPSVQPLG